jgi:hypothetical protein
MKKRLEPIISEQEFQVCYWHRVAVNNYFKLMNGEIKDSKILEAKAWQTCYNCPIEYMPKCKTYLGSKI